MTIIWGDGVALDAAGDTSLRAAIEEGNALAVANTINFSGTVFGAGLHNIWIQTNQLELSAGFTINGPTTATVAITPIITPMDNFRVMEVLSTSTTTIKDLILSGGNLAAPGGGISNHGILRLERVKVQNCHGSTGGGIANYKSLTVIDSHITYNTAVNGNGGGIFTNGNVACTTLIQNSLVGNNTAANGAGVAVDRDATLTIENSQIRDNIATGLGGGIYGFGASVSMTGGKLESNSAQDGGGLYNNIGTGTLTNVDVKNNTASAWGGGVHAKAGTTTVTGCTFDGNAATGGGAKISWEAFGGVNSTITVSTCIGVTQADVTQKT